MVNTVVKCNNFTISWKACFSTSTKNHFIQTYITDSLLNIFAVKYKSLKLFKYCFPVKTTYFKLDNISATATLRSICPNEVDKICSLLGENGIKSTFTNGKIGGTAQVFFTGKVNLLGSKSLPHLIRMVRLIKTIFKHE